MLMQQVRQVGHSYVVTIPKEEVERLGLRVNDLVAVEVRKLQVTPQLTPEIAVAHHWSRERYAAVFDYLADH
jgi:antitoxin component of MazEF toxin-antitoxin module